MPNPTAEKPAGAAAPPPKPAKPGIGEALRQILTGPDEPDEAKLIARRRRFVMASVLGFLGVNFVMFLRFFLPRALYEPKTTFTIGYPSDFGFGGHQVPERAPHLGGPQYGRHLRDLGHLYAPGMHAGLEGQRK